MRYVILFLAVLLVPAAPAVAELPSVEVMLTDRSLGAADAPVTMVEISSLTCPHCATFHRQILPKIKEAYIDTGKVRLLYRDFPLNSLSLGAAALSRCVDGQRYFAFLDTLYEQQAQWSQSSEPLKDLARIARLAGLSQTDFEACLASRPLIEGIQKRAETVANELAIRSTPTILVGSERVEGAQSFESFRDAIERALKAAGVKSAAPSGDDGGKVVAGR
jgi:protein-disulfide isomerase